MLKRTELREFAIIGARERVVALERERQRIFTEFPELATSYVAASNGVNGHAAPRPVKTSKRAKGRKARENHSGGDKQSSPKLLAWLHGVEKPVRIVDVADHFGITTMAASLRLRKLRVGGLVKSVRKAEGGRLVALYELTKKGEDAGVKAGA